MTAEQWLADLEAKADAVLTVQDSTDHVIRAVKGIALATAANPIAVKRLVAMVRASAFNAARSKGLFNDPAYWLDTAYQQTEPKP